MQTARITPPQLATDFKDLIEHLALRWANAELSPDWFWEGQQLPEPISYLYIDYLNTIGTLLLTTQEPDCTQLIFMSVLNQAVQLGKSSLWVEEELKFEGMIHGADRADFLRLDLEQTASSNTGILDDATLDRYNERLTRFAIPQDGQ